MNLIASVPEFTYLLYISKIKQSELLTIPRRRLLELRFICSVCHKVLFYYVIPCNYLIQCLGRVFPDHDLSWVSTYLFLFLFFFFIFLFFFFFFFVLFCFCSV